MSSKSARKVNLPKTTAVPRQLDVIKDEYARFAQDAGQRQYELSIRTEELKQLNEMLKSLNNEAAARIALDKPQETKPEETKNV